MSPLVVLLLNFFFCCRPFQSILWSFDSSCSCPSCSAVVLFKVFLSKCSLLVLSLVFLLLFLLSFFFSSCPYRCLPLDRLIHPLVPLILLLWQYSCCYKVFYLFLSDFLFTSSLINLGWNFLFDVFLFHFFFSLSISSCEFFIEQFLCELSSRLHLHSQCCESLFPLEAEVESKCQLSRRCQVSKALH